MTKKSRTFDEVPEAIAFAEDDEHFTFLEFATDSEEIVSGQVIRALEGPRKVKLALNQSVLRLIGLRYALPKTDAVDFSVFQ